MNMKIFKSLFFLIFSFMLASCTKNHDTNFYERLKSAVEAGNEKKIEKLLTKSAHLTNTEYEILLNIAMKDKCNLSIPILFIKSGYPVDKYRLKRDKKEMSLLYFAINEHDFSSAQELLNLDADILMAVNVNGEPFDCPLFCAMKTRANDLLIYMIDKLLETEEDTQKIYDILFQGFQKYTVSEKIFEHIFKKNNFTYDEKSVNRIVEIISSYIGPYGTIDYIRLILENKGIIITPNQANKIFTAILENKNQEMLDYFFSFQDIYEKIRLSPKTPITIINYFNSSFGKEIIYRLKNEKLNFEDGEPYFHIALDIQEFNSIPWLVEKGARVDVAADYYNVRLAPEEFALYLSERLSHDYTGEGITDSDSQLSEEYKKWAKYFDDIKQTSTHSK